MVPWAYTPRQRPKSQYQEMIRHSTNEKMERFKEEYLSQMLLDL
jgi:hypothetical protein